MKPIFWLPATVLAAAWLVPVAAAAETPQENIARIQRLLEEPVKIGDELQQKMPLSKLLQTMEERWLKEHGVSLTLDEEAFGKDLPAIAAAEVQMPRSVNVSFHTALRRLMRRMPELAGEVDYAIRPNRVVITQARLAAHKVVYPVRDVVEQLPRLLPGLRKSEDWPFLQEDRAALSRDVKDDDGPALLVRHLLNSVDLRPWESVAVHNGTRLVVEASPSRHEMVDDLLHALRSLADTHVIMNARLYEVDRDFYAEHVAPLFGKEEERPAVVRIDGPLLKKLVQQNLLLEGDDGKIHPGQQALFLSRQSAFRFALLPPPEKKEDALVPPRVPVGTGLAGVSFTARPVVSSDRRYLRVEITQHVAQLAGIEKVKKLDPATGKDVEVEVPTMHRATVTGTVQIPDADPILMPVEYRPPGQDTKDKVWLLAARPFIWIEAEVKALRQDGGDLTPKGVWESELSKEEPPPDPAKRLPLNDDIKEILQAVVTDVLTNPALKDTRAFYGTPKDMTVALADSKELGWPKDFEPATHGYRLVAARYEPFGNRVLGIRLDKFDLKPMKTGLGDAPIQVCLSNVGGCANGAVIGGCLVYYTPKKVGQRWTVEGAGALDP